MGARVEKEGLHVLVIFVCTSNTCRSPMCEAVARRWGESKGLADVLFASRWVSARRGAFFGSDAQMRRLLGFVQPPPRTPRYRTAPRVRALPPSPFRAAHPVPPTRSLSTDYEPAGSPPGKTAIEAAAALGYNHSAHRSKLLTADDIVGRARARYIVGVR